MYRYKNLLIPLNLTSMDDAVINYASMVSKMSKSEKAYFLHVKRPSEVPKEILEEYPQLLNISQEHRLKKMRESVESGFRGHPDTEIIFEVKEGYPLEVVLGEIVEKDIDLILVGRKKDAAETRRLPVNLTRKAPCSVLIIPQDSDHSIESILVPIDFSEFCANALELAVNLAIAYGISVIHCLHVFRLPIGYYKTGKSQAEFTEIMKKNARVDYERFIRNIDLKGVKLEPIFMMQEKPYKAIQSMVEKNEIDLVVLGARGRNAGAGLLLGSVTENIIQNVQVPIFAVKKKGTGLSFLEVLLKYL
ncbi:MAG TPA: universal stress protein [Cyclobacteriaceae bacterium]